MFKKAGIAIIALGTMLGFVTPQPAKAGGVHFGVTFGNPAYAYPAPYFDGYPTPYTYFYGYPTYPYSHPYRSGHVEHHGEAHRHGGEHHGRH